MLMREDADAEPARDAFPVAFRASVPASPSASSAKSYPAADLGLEGSLIAGILGGYVTGLLSGVLISLPAMSSGGEQLTMPLLAGVGVLGGLLRDWRRIRRRSGASPRSSI